MNKINLAVLYLEYPSGKYPNSWDTLNMYLKSLYNHCNISIIRINNMNDSNDYHCQVCHQQLMTSEYNNYSMPIYNISGSNSEWEFSGFQKGINFIKENNIEYDAILVVNDSFVKAEYHILKNMFSINTIKGCIQENAMVGRIDRLDYAEQFRNHLYTIDGNDVVSWIRTCCFYLPKDIINNINMVSYKQNDLTKFISSKYNGRYFLHNCPMSQNMQRQMIAWLTKYWDQKFVIEENWDLWIMKVLCMINEKMLYRQVYDQNFRIYDYSEFINE